MKFITLKSLKQLHVSCHLSKLRTELKDARYKFVYWKLPIYNRQRKWVIWQVWMQCHCQPSLDNDMAWCPA